MYLPKSGPLRFLFVAWLVATMVAAILFAAGTIPAQVSACLGVSMTTVHELYSIARRQSHRATT
jgi:hypothetical protein